MTQITDECTSCAGNRRHDESPPTRDRRGRRAEPQSRCGPVSAVPRAPPGQRAWPGRAARVTQPAGNARPPAAAGGNGARVVLGQVRSVLGWGLVSAPSAPRRFDTTAATRRASRGGRGTRDGRFLSADGSCATEPPLRGGAGRFGRVPARCFGGSPLLLSGDAEGHRAPGPVASGRGIRTRRRTKPANGRSAIVAVVCVASM